MELNEIDEGQIVWLVVNNYRQVKLKVMDASSDPVKCRFPDGHIEDIYADEIEPV